jgi:hypothetical protein
MSGERRYWRTVKDHSGYMVKVSGDGESWQQFAVIPMVDVRHALADEAFCSVTGSIDKRAIYEHVCETLGWRPHEAVPGHSFARKPIMRLNHTRVLVVQTGGLDI